MTFVLQKVKDFLVSLGADNSCVRLALYVHARRCGFRLKFDGNVIIIRRAGRRLILNHQHFNLVPIMLEDYDRFFEWIETQRQDGDETLDFSVPGFHRYKRFGIGFHFPGIPEDYSMEAYTRCYRPKPGDLVFDVGAHAGMTTYFLSHMVGPAGRVISFEPDDSSYEYLLRNIEHHGLQNVTPVKKAMAASTGCGVFNMDGTMAAGLSQYLIYRDTGKQVPVETLSFPDACREFGLPAYVKMDIEGAEVELVHASLPFLREHPIHLAFDSYHRLQDGSYTYTQLEPLLGSIGYQVASSADFGEMFTWAEPAEVLITAV